MTKAQSAQNATEKFMHLSDKQKMEVVNYMINHKHYDVRVLGRKLKVLLKITMDNQNAQVNAV